MARERAGEGAVAMGGTGSGRRFECAGDHRRGVSVGAVRRDAYSHGDPLGAGPEVRKRQAGGVTVRGCEVAVPPGAIAAVLDGKALRWRDQTRSASSMFGDTGCRLRRNAFQDCNDPAAWPFPKIAAVAATARPIS